VEVVEFQAYRKQVQREVRNDSSYFFLIQQCVNW